MFWFPGLTRRFPEKQKVATGILRRGIEENSIRVPHQAIIEFVAAVTRRVRGHVILDLPNALREAEEMLAEFTILCPNEASCVRRSAVALRIS
jgi:hypothetical protein